MELRKSKLVQIKQEELIKYFVLGATARSAAALSGVNSKTAVLFFHKLRQIIAAHLEAEAAGLSLDGEIEVDESYFGGARKGKRGRGAAGKTPVFGLLKRNGRVYAVPVPNARTETVFPIIRKTVKPDSIVYTDYLSSYDILDVSEFKHKRISHSRLFADRDNHINGIENFWNQAKRYMRKFNGIPKQHFYLYLKECEWRFNYRPAENLVQVLTQWMK